MVNTKLKFPIYGGSTGGWLKAAVLEEKYYMTWTSTSSLVFEMPIGGAAIMRPGQNDFIFARKEQCLALGTQLRSLKISDYKIYRILADQTIDFLHPNDGEFPEKVKEGRLPANLQERGIGMPERAINISSKQPNTTDV